MLSCGDRGRGPLREEGFVKGILTAIKRKLKGWGALWGI
jgi:hypothetical protein